MKRSAVSTLAFGAVATCIREHIKHNASVLTPTWLRFPHVRRVLAFLDRLRLRRWTWGYRADIILVISTSLWT